MEKFLNKISVSLDDIFIYEKKLVNQDPGSGPAGLQVNPGQVKT